MNDRQPLHKLFFRYVAPSVAAMWCFSIYTMIDGIFVGRGVGPLALAAVNLSMPFISFVFAVALLIAVGSSTLISYYLGRKDGRSANRLFTLNLIVLVTIALGIAGVSLFYLEELVLFLGAAPDTLPLAMDYLGIIILFSPFFMIAYSLEVLVKADGFPVFSIIVVALAAVVNLVLDYLFVIRLQYGVQGAAVATGLSQFISFLVFMVYFLRGNSRLSFQKPEIRRQEVIGLFKVGSPEAISELSAGFTIFLFNFVIGRHLGSQGHAAFAVMMYLNNLVVLTMIGINQGIQPLVSYYIGKGEEWKAKALLKTAMKTGFGFSLFFFVGSVFFTETLVSFFINREAVETFAMASYGLKLFSTGFLLIGFNLIISGYFTALRETRKALFMAFTRSWGLISFGLFILPEFFGSTGIWMAPLFYEGTMLFISFGFLLSYHKTSLKEEYQPL